MPTLAQHMGRKARREMDQAVAEANYGGGKLYAPLEFKAESEEDAFNKPVKFHGFANTGKPDLGFDVVDSRAFSNSTLQEFLKFGRQLFFMHDRYAQIGEITAAKRVAKGTRSLFGVEDGGLLVEGFVDSPVDDDTGWIPDHELAKVIHFARMQVKKGRLKLLSIGWRPTKTEAKKVADPRRGGELHTFRIVKALILSEISLVTMAMNPQSMVELRKAYQGAYGEEIATALFCDDIASDDLMNTIPEKVDDFSIDGVKRVIENHAKELALRKVNDVTEMKLDKPGDTNQGLCVVSLDDRIEKKVQLVSLSGEVL